MKNKIYFIVLLLAGCVMSSCESDDKDNQNELEKSYIALSDFKKETNNSYKYTTTFQSWAGFGWETTIVVSNGSIIQRHFKYTNTEKLENNIPEEELEWTENGNDIGSHTNSGSDPLTLDEIYAKAKQDWLQKRDNAKTHFETKNNGLISTCGYVEDGCQDDCFRGIHIKSIEALQEALVF